ncbi:hypothetical protein AB0A98_06165 [Streptomyces chrestomyceticus]|uniref:hypothetical protein n=1 Tax=Streptomyces chrestomyceticus TaxID=68185 RepID=UPI00340D17FE
MSTQSTAPPDAETQRRRHLAAMAVAESIIKTSPILPVTIAVTCLDLVNPRVSVQHESVAGVEAWAHALGVRAVTVPFQPGDPRPFVSITTVIDEVPAQAWALLDAAAVSGPAPVGAQRAGEGGAAA